MANVHPRSRNGPCSTLAIRLGDADQVRRLADADEERHGEEAAAAHEGGIDVDERGQRFDLGRRHARYHSA
jgi:hypothetical protein